MDLSPPVTRPVDHRPLGGRGARYVLATLVICVAAAVVGETFFPAGLRGDTGGNDFEGLAALFWGAGALLACGVAVVAVELLLMVRDRRRTR